MADIKSGYISFAPSSSLAVVYAVVLAISPSLLCRGLGRNQRGFKLLSATCFMTISGMCVRYLIGSTAC
jgi:hypothetical protein